MLASAPPKADPSTFDRILSAAQKDDHEAIRRLAALGVPPTHPNRVGQTPLHISTLWGNVASLQTLISLIPVGDELVKAVNLKNLISGATPLHCGTNSNKALPGRRECVRMLLDAGADGSVKDAYDSVPADYTDDSVLREMLGVESNVLCDFVKNIEACLDPTTMDVQKANELMTEMKVHISSSEFNVDDVKSKNSNGSNCIHMLLSSSVIQYEGKIYLLDLLCSASSVEEWVNELDIRGRNALMLCLLPCIPKSSKPGPGPADDDDTEEDPANYTTQEHDNRLKLYNKIFKSIPSDKLVNVDVGIQFYTPNTQMAPAVLDRTLLQLAVEYGHTQIITGVIGICLQKSGEGDLRELVSLGDSEDRNVFHLLFESGFYEWNEKGEEIAKLLIDGLFLFLSSSSDKDENGVKKYISTTLSKGNKILGSTSTLLMSLVKKSTNGNTSKINFILKYSSIDDVMVKGRQGFTALGLCVRTGAQVNVVLLLEYCKSQGGTVVSDLMSIKNDAGDDCFDIARKGGKNEVLSVLEKYRDGN